jgi:hypothetical protein
MHKLILLFTVLFSFVNFFYGQAFYKSDFVEMKAFVINNHSGIFFQIKNISDSVILINEKEINFIKVNDAWAADLSLLEYGVSLLPPGPGQFMNFRRLESNTTYTIMMKMESKYLNTNTFKLFIRLEYMVIPSKFNNCDGILYEDFYEFVKSNNLTTASFEGVLHIKNHDNGNSCIRMLGQ